MSAGRQIGDIQIASDQIVHATRRGSTERVIAYLLEHDWFDVSRGAGIVWQHERLRGFDGDPIAILLDTAVHVQDEWENGRGKPPAAAAAAS